MAIPNAGQPEVSVETELEAYSAFVALHRYQLEQIPEALWPKLFDKLRADKLDAGSYFCLEELSEEEATQLGSAYALRVVDQQPLAREGDIFLIDHAWTTAPERARKELMANPDLLTRITAMLGLPEPEEEEEEEEKDDTAADEELASGAEDAERQAEQDGMVAMVAEQAKVSQKEARATLIAEKWDLISAISTLTLAASVHETDRRLQEAMIGQVDEDQAQKRAMAHAAKRIDAVLDVMWRYAGAYQITTIDEAGEHRQDYVWYMMDEVGSAIRHADAPNCRVIPFVFIRGPSANDSLPYSIFYPLQDLKSGERVTRDMVPADITDQLTREAYLCAFRPPSITNRQRLIRAYEDLGAQITPLSDDKLAVATAPLILPEPSSGTLRVYTDTPFVHEHLNLAGTELVQDRETADLLWLSGETVGDIHTLRPRQCVSQLPGEACVVFKHLLTKLIWETYGRVDWYPATYNLQSQLTPAVGHYLHQVDQGAEAREENIWILKPWNAAQASGITMTSSLSRLVRARDALPSIVQQYVARPLLFRERKFDLRYIVLVRRAHPLSVAVHQTFWARLAKQPYTLEDVHDYEKHLTVMSAPNYKAIQQHGSDFVKDLLKEQPNLQWSVVQKEIDAVIKRRSRCGRGRLSV
ncbi:tubulin-tyrosine ligase family-domain-containing protein [Thamnocephalis sphaerospora]|uniref:Tubulin-tyrosine ligase family-domain-containing protein n=1 Tax=Thamnocephalis sphaerospora TaxID=78915 RepID=A0A4P9XW65_9FUNG|nr:tubulin-tyrosine ligase family-domain-containing protein [Thamnocephalis sphaerospora]|eukprot:RKP10544.1 tubulin-tyrosine ligase family-domain-containing protein [Thamnocephalis sphaerospora]